MVASFAAAAARRGQRWTYLVRIESIGDYDGLHTWSINAPDFVGNSDRRYLQRDTVAALPRITPERTKSMLGGMPEAGSATVELVDYRDLITAARRTDRRPVATLGTSPDASTTTILLTDGASLPTGNQVVWIGGEALRIASRSGNTLTVETGGRGWLDTIARAHSTGDLVYASTPFLRTRRMTIYLAPEDADNDAVATSYAIGTYRIDRSKLGRKLGAWVLSGPTEIRDLGRLVGSRATFSRRVRTVYGNDYILMGAAPGESGAIDRRAAGSILSTWPDGQGYAVSQRTHEIIRFDNTTGGGYAEPRIAERGVLGTKQDDIEEGDLLRPVLVADLDSGSFRWSPATPTPSAVRTSGTWEITAHPVDILLCVLTSAAHVDDALELVNYNPAFGNWSSLPPGYGIGYPASRIDWGSFLAVKAAYSQYALPALVVGEGDKAPTFGEWVTRAILEPFGWFLTTTGGLLTLVAPRILLQGESPDIVLDADSIIEYSEPEESYDLVAGAVTYRYRGAHGEMDSTTVKSSDYIGLFGGRAQYTVEDDAVVIDVPGVIAGGTGTSALLTMMSQRRLVRAVRAPWRIVFTVDASTHAIAVGHVASITHPDMVDLEAGTRGWTNVIGQITAASRVILDDQGRARRTLTVLVYPSFRGARVAPSAVILSVSGTGPWVCSVENVRYCAEDAVVLGLPIEDALAFEATDRVKTITRAGVDVVTGQYTVTGAGGDEVIVTGSTAPTPGHVLVFDNYSVATAAQRGRFAFWANDRAEIAAGVPAVLYAEV